MMQRLMNKLYRKVALPHSTCIRTLQWHHYRQQPVLAIRHEDKSRWERRAPLSPHNVQDLKKEGVKVLLQPSPQRIFPASDYVKAGAVESDNIDEAELILGVKEVPINKLIPHKKYAFFSHTIKGQEHNMPLLAALLRKSICLIDYEKLVDNKGKRLVAFGKYAGMAGVINLFNGIGLRLLGLGYQTPFIHVAPAHNYASVDAAKEALHIVGQQIEQGYLPSDFCPMIFTITGSGNVSQGAQELMKVLPHEYISPKDLKHVKETGGTRRLYFTVVHREDYIVRDDGKEYNEQDYLQHPSLHRSSFAEKIAPYTTCLINCTFWAPGIPRLLTEADIKLLLQNIIAISDISADIKGSLEFVNEYTTIEDPFLLYNPFLNERNNNIFSDDEGILMTTVDNLPAQMPREATNYFGTCLKPFLFEFLNIDLTRSLEDQPGVSKEVKEAIVTYNGSLTPNYQYLADKL